LAVDVLENWARESAFRKQWLKTWEKLGGRILQFPKWMQTIILQDVNTAVENRVATMEMILQSMKKKEAYK
jgi:hypothetical protein